MRDILRRILEISKFENVSIGAVERKIGASKGVLSRAIANGTDIQSKWIQSVVENYPQYSAEWLLIGNGPMLRDDKGGPVVVDTLEQAVVTTDTSLSGTQQPIERNSNVGQCSPIKDPIDSICDAANGSNIEVIRELMTKITEQAIEIGRLRERISLINSNVKNVGGGILPPPTKPNSPKSNPPAMPVISQSDMPIRKPRTESTSGLVAEKSAHSIRKSR